MINEIVYKDRNKRGRGPRRCAYGSAHCTSRSSTDLEIFLAVGVEDRFALA